VPCEEAPLVTASIAAGVLTVIPLGLTVPIRLTIVSAILTVGVTTDSEVNSVINGSTLGNWHDDSLMVPSGRDGRHPVCTSRETLGDIGGQLAIGGGGVEALEEREDTWVGGLRRVKRWDLLNDDVVVSDNLPTAVQLLRCSVVSIGSVGEGTGLHSVNIQGDSERGVSLDVTTIGRELELDRWHVVDTRNIAHRRRVARTALDLLAICDGLADAEANEVVGADEGVCFTGRLTLTIDVLNNGGVQSKGGLRVGISAVVVTTGLGVVTTVLSVIATVLSVVPAILIVVATVLVVVAAVLAAAELVVLTGYKTI